MLNNLLISIGSFFISLVILILLGFVYSFLNIEPPKNNISVSWFIILNILIIGPIAEELLFRLVLTSVPDVKYLTISTIVTLLVILKLLFFSKNNNNIVVVLIVVWILIVWVNYILYQKNMTIINQIGLIIISSTIFAIVHFKNYLTSDNVAVLTPFILAIFLSALLLSYVRVKCGIQWSIFTHMLMNLIPSIGMVLKLCNKI